jgi:hypothetical protein
LSLLISYFFLHRSRKQEWGAENPSEVVNKFRNYEI